MKADMSGVNIRHNVTQTQCMFYVWNINIASGSGIAFPCPPFKNVPLLF